MLEKKEHQVKKIIQLDAVIKVEALILCLQMLNFSNRYLKNKNIFKLCYLLLLSSSLKISHLRTE